MLHTSPVLHVRPFLLPLVPPQITNFSIRTRPEDLCSSLCIVNPGALQQMQMRLAGLIDGNSAYRQSLHALHLEVSEHHLYCRWLLWTMTQTRSLSEWMPRLQKPSTCTATKALWPASRSAACQLACFSLALRPHAL